jgi:hypothetical protein
MPCGIHFLLKGLFRGSAWKESLIEELSIARCMSVWGRVHDCFVKQGSGALEHFLLAEGAVCKRHNLLLFLASPLPKRVSEG